MYPFSLCWRSTAGYVDGVPGVARHGGRPQYRANEADHQARESALRRKVCLLAIPKRFFVRNDLWKCGRPHFRKYVAFSLMLRAIRAGLSDLGVA
jgi:hypothetical protein